MGRVIKPLFYLLIIRKPNAIIDIVMNEHNCAELEMRKKSQVRRKS